MTTSLADIRRTICCPSGTCCSPRDCYAEDRSRSQLVDIHHAARAVHALLVRNLRDYPRSDGPMTRSRTYGEEG